MLVLNSFDCYSLKVLHSICPPLFPVFRLPNLLLARRVAAINFRGKQQHPHKNMKAFVMCLCTAALLAFGINTESAETQNTPKTVIHVVTVKWKADATPKQIQAALDGVKELATAYKGI